MRRNRMSVNCIKAILHHVEALVWLGVGLYVRGKGMLLWSAFPFAMYAIHKTIAYCLLAEEKE